MGTLIIVLFVLFAIVCIACGIWQINLAVHHPKEWERLEMFKKAYVKEQEEMAGKALAVGKAAAGMVMKVGGKYLKK